MLKKKRKESRGKKVTKEEVIQRIRLYFTENKTDSEIRRTVENSLGFSLSNNIWYSSLNKYKDSRLGFNLPLDFCMFCSSIECIERVSENHRIYKCCECNIVFCLPNFCRDIPKGAFVPFVNFSPHSIHTDEFSCVLEEKTPEATAVGSPKEPSQTASQIYRIQEGEKSEGEKSSEQTFVSNAQLIQQSLEFELARGIGLLQHVDTHGVRRNNLCEDDKKREEGTCTGNDFEGEKEEEDKESHMPIELSLSISKIAQTCLPLMSESQMERFESRNRQGTGTSDLARNGTNGQLFGTTFDQLCADLCTEDTREPTFSQQAVLLSTQADAVGHETNTHEKDSRNSPQDSPDPITKQLLDMPNSQDLFNFSD